MVTTPSVSDRREMPAFACHTSSQVSVKAYQKPFTINTKNIRETEVPIDCNASSVFVALSPFSIYAVSIKDCVCTSYWKFFNKPLSDYQTVKRIAVMKR